MASHLTVTTAANPGVSVKGLNAQASAEPGKDVFADLLDETEESDEAAKPAPAAAASAAGLVDMALDLGTDTDEKPDETPDPIAAPIDGQAPIQQPASPQAILTGIIDSLTAMRAAAQNGQAPSPEDLAKLNQSLDALAGALGVSLDQLPTMDELAAMATQPLPASGTMEAQLISTLAPIAKDMLTQAANTTTTDAALADQLKAVGDKLAALLKGLNDGAVDLAAGADTAQLDIDLEAALDRLLKPAAPVTTAASTPAFTPPKLETAEPTLAGKNADTLASTSSADDDGTTLTAPTDTDPVLKADTAADKGSDAGDKRDKARDAKIDAVVTAAAKTVDTPPNAAQAAVHAATRPEAAPGLRPVIAGYQTSQQQLNLPQIAFELVRQVNDGNSRFQMRLDPPELGKIEVRLDIDRSGQVTARLTVEKAETLDLMQRDQRGLEKALQQAGLDSSKTNLEFSLKQNPFSGGQQGQDQGRQSAFLGDSVVEAEEAPAPQINLYRASLSASGVNIIA